MSFMHLRQAQLQRREAASEIFTCLETFEKDLGRTLASGSHLIGQLPLARTKANVSAVVGQDVIDRFVAALAHVSQAMGAAVEGHHQLELTRRAMRLPEMAGGDKDIIPNFAHIEGGIPERERLIG